MTASTADFSVLKDERGHEFVDTACVGKCPLRYLVDDQHPEYARVKTALARGDRSVVFCYHRRFLP